VVVTGREGVLAGEMAEFRLLLILVSLAGMLVGVLSAMWSARQAARTDVLAAVRAG
jgi:hypothetical protein